MTETGKPCIIPTSSGALKDAEWRLPDEPAREKRQARYEENRIRYADLIERAKREKAASE